MAPGKRRKIPLKDRLTARFFKSNKKTKISLTILLLVGGIYVLLHFFVLKTDPLQIFLLSVFDSYQYFIEGISNFYLRITNTGVSITDHVVYYENLAYEAIENGMLLKKLTIFSILLIWLIAANFKSKFYYTALLTAALILFLPIGIALNAFFNSFDNELISPYLIGKTIPLIAIITILIFWIRRNALAIKNIFIRFDVAIDIFEKKGTSIIIIIYLFFLLKTFITGYYTFEPWVNLLFNISKWILNLMGYDARVAPFYLYGDNVLIFMNKSCLGFMTMLVFASLIYLTGQNNLKTWLFIVVGVIFLNLVNIIRFVLLYIHIDKYGRYLLKLDIHDIYTSVVYVIVFLLWIFWFEKYSNLNLKNK